MTNKEIANRFQELAQLMEFHGENPFKIRTYLNVYATLRKLNEEVGQLKEEELRAIKGIGDAVAAKIRELEDTGEMRTLRKYQDQTPAGIREMLTIRGLGPKKIRTLYDQLQVESVGELQYAIEENRLLELPGFGIKTQQDILDKLAYFQEARGFFRLSTMDEVAERLDQRIRKLVPEWSGIYTRDFRRRMPILDRLEIICSNENFSALQKHTSALFTSCQSMDAPLHGKFDEIYPVVIHSVEKKDWNFRLVKNTGGMIWEGREVPEGHWKSEEECFTQAHLPYMPPECRDLDAKAASLVDVESLIRQEDIQGMIHLHTTYSDGINSLEDMAKEAEQAGYQYLVVTDHSKSAVYANGLSIERLEEQWKAIDAWNQNAQIPIFKGIECDILTDGDMDYPLDVLRRFDVVIASIHSQLKMDEEKATQRLIRAIEHPQVHIIGHPTGRLLLSRLGYPVNHKRIIDACAANGVYLELNANPFRLDLDWQWIPYAREKGVMISINPDAHSLRGYTDMKYGISTARKGGLMKHECLNALPMERFAALINRK